MLTNRICSDWILSTFVGPLLMELPFDGIAVSHFVESLLRDWVLSRDHFTYLYSLIKSWTHLSKFGLAQNNSYLTFTSQLPTHSLPHPLPRNYGDHCSPNYLFLWGFWSVWIGQFSQVSSLNVEEIMLTDNLANLEDDDWDRWVYSCKKPVKALMTSALVEQQLF